MMQISNVCSRSKPSSINYSLGPMLPTKTTPHDPCTKLDFEIGRLRSELLVERIDRINMEGLVQQMEVSVHKQNKKESDMNTELENYKSEISQLQSFLDNKNKLIMQLQREKRSCSVLKCHAKLKNMKFHLESAIADKERLNNRVKILEGVQSSYNRLQSCYADLEEVVVKCKHDLQMEREKSAHLSSSVAENQSCQIELKQEVSTLQIDLLESQLSYAREEENSIRKSLDLERLECSFLGLQRSYSNIQEENAEHLSSLRGEKERNDRLCSVINDLHDVKTENVTLRQNIKMLSSKVSEMEALKEQKLLVEEQLGDLKLKSQDLEKTKLENNMLRVQVQDLTPELENIRQRNKSLHTEVEEKSSLLCNMGELEIKISKLLDQAANDKTTIGNLREKLEMAQNNNKILRAQGLEQQSAATGLEKLKIEKDELQAELETLRSLNQLLSCQQQQINSEHGQNLNSCKSAGRHDRTKILQDELDKSEKSLSIVKTQIQDIRGNVRVLCRVRPGRNELKKSDHLRYPSSWHGPNRSISCRNETFSFNHVFQPSSTQIEIYEQISGAVEQVLCGRNVCIMAYGQTGSGKTHTMEGTESEPGINIRALRHLFNLIKHKSGFDVSVNLSVLEFYREQLKDLLSDGKEKHLAIQVSGAGPLSSVHVQGLKSVFVENVDTVRKLLKQAHQSRKIAVTSMNARSSRSHLAVQIQVCGVPCNCGNEPFSGKLLLVDLAGSERVSKSHVSGEQLLEAQYINRSLSALGNVFAALERNSQHIPYRDSKLTRYLQDVIGGNSISLMIVAVSGDVSDSSETTSSLKFAQRVSNVVLRKKMQDGLKQKLRELEHQESALMASLQNIIFELDINR